MGDDKIYLGWFVSAFYTIELILFILFILFICRFDPGDRKPTSQSMSVCPCLRFTPIHFFEHSLQALLP